MNETLKTKKGVVLGMVFNRGQILSEGNLWSFTELYWFSFDYMRSETHKG